MIENVIFIYKDENIFEDLPPLLAEIGCKGIVKEAIFPEVFTAVSEAASIIGVIYDNDLDPRHIEIILQLLFERRCMAAYIVTRAENDKKYKLIKYRFNDLQIIAPPFSKMFLYNILITKLNEFGLQDDYRSMVKSQIISLLYRLRFDSTHKGFECTVEAVYYIISKGNADISVKNEVMEYVGRKCSCEPSAAEQAIRAERLKMYRGLGERNVRKLIPKYHENEKKNNKTFLYACAEFVALRTERILGFCRFELGE